MNSPSPKTPHRLPPVAIALGVLFFVGLMGLMLYGVSRSGKPDRDSLPSALLNKPAPAFSLPVLHDPSVHVTDKQLRGAPYLLNVWAAGARPAAMNTRS